VGYVRRAHGIKGAVVVNPSSDDPERFVAGARFTTDSETYPALTVGRVQAHNDGLLVTFEQIDDRSRAEQLRGLSIFISPVERRELGSDEFWPDDLVGLQVVDRAGELVGRVTAIIPGSAQDRLEIAGEGATFEVPFVVALVPEVDVEGGRVVVDLPDGLTDPG
jgi:16S rRNA processing protein RimM